jgi:hypothetical protein
MYVMTRGTRTNHWALIFGIHIRSTDRFRTESIFESRVPTDWDMLNLPIIEITSTTWNPADKHRSAPHSNTMHAVDCISTAWGVLWSPSTASQMAIFPASDLRCVSSSLYANTILVHDALTGTHVGTSGISATFTSEQHSSVTFENLSRK